MSAAVATPRGTTTTMASLTAHVMDQNALHGKLIVKTVVGRAVPLFPHVVAVREAVPRARSNSARCEREQESKDDTAVHVLLYLDPVVSSAGASSRAAVQRLQSSVGLPLRMTTPSTTSLQRVSTTRSEVQATHTAIDTDTPPACIPIAALRLRYYLNDRSSGSSSPRQVSCADYLCLVDAYRTRETMQALLVATERLAQTLFHSHQLLLRARLEDRSLCEGAGYVAVTAPRDEEVAADTVYLLKELGQHDALFSARL